MHQRIGYIGLVIIASAAAPVTAQTRDSTKAERREASRVLDHTFTSTIGEPVRIFLAKNTTYRAEIQGSGIRLQLKTLEASTQAPLIQRFLAGNSAGGSSTYEIKPRADAMYVFTTLSGDAAQPVSLRVYTVKRAPARQP